MMQDTKLNDRSLQTAKKKVRQLLPEYCLYVHLCPTDERGSIAKTAILLHRALTHAAAPYDLGNLCKGDPQFSREQWVNTQVLHHKDPHTGMTALWVNAYCPTSDHPSSQADTLKNVSSILRMLSERHDLVVLGGDWNASLHVRSRPGGRALQEADSRLRDWVEQQQLSTVSCTTATFSRYRQDAYHATIDYVFISKHPLETELQYASTNVTSPDPSHDHKIQKVTLLDLPISGLPTRSGPSGSRRTSGLTSEISGLPSYSTSCSPSMT